LKDGSEIVKNHGRTAKEAERLEGEVKRVGGRYIDTRQYTARPRIMGKLKASLLGEAAVWAPLIFFWVPLIFLGFCLLNPISAESKVVSTEAECTVDRSVTGIQSISGLDPWHQLFSHLWSQVLLLLPSDASNQSNKHHQSVAVSVGVGYIDTRQYTARPCIMGKLKAALLESAGAQRVAVVGQGGSGILTEHCLVTVSAAGERVSMHSLTQQVLCEHLMGNTSNHSLAAATAQVRARMDEFDPNEVGTFAAGRRYAPHASTALALRPPTTARPWRYAPHASGSRP
jgi:hypothetical protein